nr:MAG TPA: hypothetical protein [Caudoviricetes sp.]
MNIITYRRFNYLIGESPFGAIKPYLEQLTTPKENRSR